MINQKLLAIRRILERDTVLTRDRIETIASRIAEVCADDGQLQAITMQLQQKENIIRDLTKVLMDYQRSCAVG